jgi:hypothetical protein
LDKTDNQIKNIGGIIMAKKISFNLKESELLYEIISHCTDHATWMREVFENGKLIPKLEEKLLNFLNEQE